MAAAAPTSALVAVVIPALDEEEGVARVVRALPADAARVVVVDNGSRDRTAEVAQTAGATVVQEPRRGYGQACLTGIAAVPDADVYAFIDADFSDHPEQLATVLAPIRAGVADLVIGSRRLGRGLRGGHPWHAILGTRFCVLLMNTIFGSRATDLGPFRAIRADALRRLGMRDRDFGWTVEMQAKAALSGLRVIEVPVDYRPRLGRSKVSGTLAGSVRAGIKILATLLRLAPAATRGRLILLTLCAALMTACVATWAAAGDQSGRIASHLGVYGLSFAAYLAALTLSRALPARALGAALALALLWRLALVAAPPLLSDDIYRYVWEGRVQLSGGNPFAWDDRPESERWTALRDDVWRGVNHKDYTAIYPPLWQLAARAVVAVSDSVPAMKLFAVLCEALALTGLGFVLRARGLLLARLLVWAWSPLALVEIAGSGHNDALGLSLTALALLALERARPAAAAACLGAAFQAKLLPALFAAAWLRCFRLPHVALGVVVAGTLLLPFIDAGAGLVASLSKYGQFWLFNETLFAPLALAAGGHVAAVRLAAALAAATALRMATRRVEPARAGLLAVAAFVLLTPNMLPWYALWLLPFLVLVDAPWALLFTGTVQLAYLVYPAWQSGERWQVGWSIRALEYLPCALVAGLPWLARLAGELRARRGAAT